MAGRILNRRVLREQADQAKQAETEGGEAAPEEKAAPKKRKAKTPAAPRARKPRAKKAPPRMVARWGVFDGSMKQLATFAYNERTAADDKLVDLRGKKKGLFFLQIVKEPMAEPEPVEATA